jgi:hypothetical protein
MGLAVASLVAVVAMAARPVRFSRQSSEERSEECSEERSEECSEERSQERLQQRSQASNRIDEAIDQARDAREGRAGLAPYRPQDAQTRPASRFAPDRAQGTIQNNS